MKALREEDIPGTPGLPAPGFGEQFFLGQNATGRLPGTHLHAPKALLFHPAPLPPILTAA